MKISINRKAYQLKFGFGMLRKLGELSNLNSYSETLQMLQKAFEDLENITFEKEDVLKNLIYAAALHAEDPKAENLKTLSVMDYVISNGDDFAKIVDAVLKSFPSKAGKLKARITRKNQQQTIS